MYPAYNVTLLNLASNAFAKTIYGNSGVGWFDPAKIALLQNAVYSTCDGLDGVKDGIISDVASCQAAFTMQTVQQTLRCPGGADTGDTCLSDAQIATVATLDSPFKLDFPLADGQQVFPHWSIIEGAKFLTGFGASRTPSHPPAATDAFQYQISDPSVHYFFTNNLTLDSINAFNPDDYQQQIVASSVVLDAANPDISAFKARGGKLILLHGTADEAISPYNTIDYYNQMVSTLGQASLDQFVRFYMVPGFGHGSGIFDAQWNPITVIDSWVTQGNAPATLTAVDGNAGASRSRPVCIYPGWPKYNGSGDVNSASSFTCVTS
jgi:feruloyl esterase